MIRCQGGEYVYLTPVVAPGIIRSDEVGGGDLDAVEPSTQRLHRVDRVVLARHAGDLAVRDLVVVRVLVGPAATDFPALIVAACK